MTTLTATQYKALTKKPEHAIQAEIITYLDRALPGTIRAVAVSNNPRSKIAGGKEKARGMRKGFPDLFLTGAFHGMIEVKREGSYLRPEQKQWRDWCAENQVPYAVCRSIDDVRETLIGWGVLRGEQQ
jgi:hypothetical protein